MDLIILIACTFVSLLLVIIKWQFSYNLLFYFVFIILCFIPSYKSIKKGTFSNIWYLWIFLWGILMHKLNTQGTDFVFDYNLSNLGASLYISIYGAFVGGIIYYIITKIFRFCFKLDKSVYAFGIPTIGFASFTSYLGSSQNISITIVKFIFITFILSALISYIPILVKDYTSNKSKFIAEIICGIAIIIQLLFRNNMFINIVMMGIALISLMFLIKQFRKMEPNQYSYIFILPIIMLSAIIVLLNIF